MYLECKEYNFIHTGAIRGVYPPLTKERLGMRERSDLQGKKLEEKESFRRRKLSRTNAFFSSCRVAPVSELKKIALNHKFYNPAAVDRGMKSSPIVIVLYARSNTHIVVSYVAR